MHYEYTSTTPTGGTTVVSFACVRLGLARGLPKQETAWTGKSPCGPALAITITGRSHLTKHDSCAPQLSHICCWLARGWLCWLGKQTTSMVNSEFRSRASGPGVRHSTDPLSPSRQAQIRFSLVSLQQPHTLSRCWRLALLEESFESRFVVVSGLPARPGFNNRPARLPACPVLFMYTVSLQAGFRSDNDRKASPLGEQPFVPDSVNENLAASRKANMESISFDACNSTLIHFGASSPLKTPFLLGPTQQSQLCQKKPRQRRAPECEIPQKSNPARRSRTRPLRGQHGNLKYRQAI